MIIIQQNSTTNLSFYMPDYFPHIKTTDIIAAEITFGTGNAQVRKLWYSYNPFQSNANLNKIINKLVNR